MPSMWAARRQAQAIEARAIVDRQLADRQRLHIVDMAEIDWSRCPEVESTADTLSGAWRVKGHRVPVSALLENFAYDETPASIARMFGLPVATVRKVLRFALRAELAELMEQDPAWTAAYAYRRDKLARALAQIDRELKRSRSR